MTILRDSLDTLTQAFQEYQQTNDQRLAELEAKKGVDPLLVEKLDKLDSFITQKSMAVQQHIIKSRPLMGNPQEIQGTDYRMEEAFKTYVRKGEANDLVQKNLSTTEQGYLVPQVFVDRINQAIETHCPLRRLCSVITISGSAVDLLLDQKGTEVGWVGESEDRVLTKNPTAAKLTIPVHEIYARIRATQKLLDDAHVNIESWLSNSVAEKMAMVEHEAFLTGNGEKKPKGILSYATTSSKNWKWGTLEHVVTQKGDQISLDDLMNLMAALKPEFMNNAVWVMSRATLKEIRKLKSSDGYYLWQPALDEKRSQTLMGYPIEIADEMPGLSSKVVTSPVLFGNFKAAYQIVDRAGISTLRDPFTAKPYVEFYTTKRVGGDIINFEALKVLKSSDAN
jgi:HK97 family phage major capsid protein